METDNSIRARLIREHQEHMNGLRERFQNLKVELPSTIQKKLNEFKMDKKFEFGKSYLKPGETISDLIRQGKKT